MPLLQNEVIKDWACAEFDYQSECHCSKTATSACSRSTCLITSQNATAPKLRGRRFIRISRLITSQNATAPKPRDGHECLRQCLITSQNATAPKHHDRAGGGVLSVARCQRVKLALQVLDRPHVGGVDVAALGEGHHAAVDVEHVHVRHERTVLRRTGEEGLTAAGIAVHEDVHAVSERLRRDRLITSQNATAPKHEFP